MWIAFVAVVAAGENLIANGSFEEQGPTGAAHWSATEGAVLGGHVPTSEVSWPTVDGSRVLALHATSATRSWTAIQSEPVSVTPGTQLILSGRIKTEGVSREGEQFDNCNLAVS